MSSMRGKLKSEPLNGAIATPIVTSDPSIENKFENVISNEKLSIEIEKLSLNSSFSKLNKSELSYNVNLLNRVESLLFVTVKVKGVSIKALIDSGTVT